MKPTFKVVIPARYGSTRLHGKPLLPLAGKPMIAHVCQRALEARAEQVIVATDDERIMTAVKAMGIEVVMTRPDHQSGTERIAEVAQLLDWPGDTIIVNVQGDEPLIPPAYIRAVANALAQQNAAQCATLAAQISDSEEIFNPNAVKVVLNQRSHALYFSRAAVPWERGRFSHAGGEPSGTLPYLRHIGMYAYTVAFLQRYVAWQACPLEAVESLEQLRILWHGDNILVNVVAQTPPAGVDTAEDLARVERLLITKQGQS